MQLETIFPAAADWVVRGGMLGSCLLIAWKVIGRLNRDDSLRRDFPPHRHVGETILYPNEYQPSEPGHLSEDDHA